MRQRPTSCNNREVPGFTKMRVVREALLTVLEPSERSKITRVYPSDCYSVARRWIRSVTLWFTQNGVIGKSAILESAEHRRRVPGAPARFPAFYYTGVNPGGRRVFSPDHSPTRVICPAQSFKMSDYYQPITAILYTRRMTAITGAVQADKV